MHVEDLTWPEYREVVATRIVVLPLGAVDAHGPHLPLSTDTIISTCLAHRLESHLDLLVLPAFPYGLRTDPPAGGGEFPGVTSLRASTLTNVVLDILRTSYRHGARRFLILDSHKANVSAVRESVYLFTEGAPGVKVMAVTWWDVVSEHTRNQIADETGVSRQDDHHAAMAETSLVMHLVPELVRCDLIADDQASRRARYLIVPVPDSLKTRSGVVYRASRATSAVGKRLADEIISNLVTAVRVELM